MKRYSRSQDSRYDQIKRSRPENVILPDFGSSGILEAESNNKSGEPLKHVEPRDSISPANYWDKINMPLEKRPIIKAILYKKDVPVPIKEYNLDLRSHYIIGRDIPKSVDDQSENEEDIDEDEHQSVVLADIGIPDPGCSKEHCVIQFRERNKKLVPYIMDLNSSNGTTLNGVLIPRARYIELRSEDSILFSEFENDSEYELLFMDVV
ncbi:Pml1 protein [Maudiozyma humilis]|uniref:Pml1 protein n=1 Tax=Maudiozyma humilis TaxID=51915 RepID=A0AAV5RQK6_MAUHU|nr:Pml1 protein [Kazachstania humilis]